MRIRLCRIPPCTEYSTAKTHGVRNIALANRIVQRTLCIIRYALRLNPKLVYILENPQTGLLRRQSFMQRLAYVDGDYCCYGFDYRKRTRFWTNRQGLGLKMCPGPGKCPKMVGNRHLTNIASNDPQQTLRCVSLQEKYSIPRALLRTLLS